MWRFGSGSAVQRLIQIGPLRVHLLNEPDFSVAPPLLDVLLTRDRLVDALVNFVPDQPIHAVAGGEAGDGFGFVLPHAAGQVVGDTEVERAVPPGGETVDVIA